MKELQEWGIEFSQSTMKMDYIFLKLKSQISWKIHNLKSLCTKKNRHLDNYLHEMERNLLDGRK